MVTKMYLPPKGEPRRGFLKKGLLGGAVLLLGGGGFLAFRPGRREAIPAGGLLVLTEREYAVVVALMRRFVWRRPGWPTPEEIGAPRDLDRQLARMDPATVSDLKRLLGLFENALPGFLFGLRTRPFTELPPEEQDRVLLEWATSRIGVRRAGFHAIRTMALSLYYANPKSWPAIGYAGPPQALWDKSAPKWKGGGTPRPPSLGQWLGDPLP